MNNVKNKSKEAIYHYISFVLKSATLVMLLPVAEIFSSPFELKLTAILLNMMYLILAVEFGFSIQISRVVGDHTDENGIRNNIEKISNISSRVFLLLVSISFTASMIYFYNIYNDFTYVNNASLILFISILIFNLQLFSTKSYALCMGTTYLITVKRMEAFLYFAAFLTYFLNSVYFQNWQIHLVIFLSVSVIRSFSLLAIERHMKNNSTNEDNQTIDVKRFLQESYRIGLATAATQLFLNTFLSKIYDVSDVRTANDINIVARLTQGVIIATRQFTDLRFYQISRDISQQSNLRLNIIKNNMYVGISSIFALALSSSYIFHQIKLNYSQLYSLSFEEIAYFVIILSFIYSIGLVSQQLLLINIFIHVGISVAHIVAWTVLIMNDRLLDVAIIALYYTAVFILCLMTGILLTKRRKNDSVS